MDVKRWQVVERRRRSLQVLRRIAMHTTWISFVLAFGLYSESGLRKDSSWVHWLVLLGDVAQVITLVALFTWIVAAAGGWWSLGQYRWGIFRPRLRREYLQRSYREVESWASLGGLRIVRINTIYAQGARGTKCLVEHVDGVIQDAWFWHARPIHRGVYAVQANTGYGYHNHMSVLYVGDSMGGSGIRAKVPSALWKAR